MRQRAIHQRLQAKKRSQAMIVGVVGYTAETWAQVKATATDPQCFEDSFEKWHKTAVATRREFLRSGVRAIECQIVPEEFYAWCAANNQQNNSTARAEFVSEHLRAAYGQMEGGK
jgi:hypothetical protein